MPRAAVHLGYACVCSIIFFYRGCGFALGSCDFLFKDRVNLDNLREIVHLNARRRLGNMLLVLGVSLYDLSTFEQGYIHIRVLKSVCVYFTNGIMNFKYLLWMFWDRNVRENKYLLYKKKVAKMATAWQHCRGELR